MTDPQHHPAVDVGAVAPPIAVLGLHYLAGVTLQDWVYIVTIFYTLLMSARLLWRWAKELRAPRDEPPAS